jgi:hypothetical protein
MATEQQGSDQQTKPGLDREDEDQDFVDQSKIDFDPDDGLYSGTAVDGSSEIPGPHADADTGELTGMDEAEQPSSENEAARQQAPHAGSEGEAAREQAADAGE